MTFFEFLTICNFIILAFVLIVLLSQEDTLSRFGHLKKVQASEMAEIEYLHKEIDSLRKELRNAEQNFVRVRRNEKWNHGDYNNLVG